MYKINGGAGVPASYMITPWLPTQKSRRSSEQSEERRRMEVPAGIAPANGGFADPCLTTWLRHHALQKKDNEEQGRKEVVM
jgi:hypothetical protein